MTLSNHEHVHICRPAGIQTTTIGMPNDTLLDKMRLYISGGLHIIRLAMQPMADLPVFVMVSPSPDCILGDSDAPFTPERFIPEHSGIHRQYDRATVHGLY